ncbi:MAG: LLM class F420-dependent oxidoreductase [Actinomycetes bacterium]
MDLRIFTEPQAGASYEQQLAVAQAAERLGFDAFFRSDHFLTMGGDGLPGPTDSWVTLGAIARETTRIRLGTLVTSSTFRLPGLLAIAVAQVDAMSAGRVDLGLGTGWMEAEHTAYGVPFPPWAERFDRLTEHLEIITGLWRTPIGETFSHSGTYYALRNAPALPKPVQDGGPPIIVGGLGQRRTPQLAARFAAEYNTPFAPLDYAREQYARVRQACDQTERDPDSMRLSFALTVCCGVDEGELQRRADAIDADLGQLRKNQLAGTPEEVVEKLLAYGEAGATRAYLQVLDMTDLEHLELLAERVMPHV